MIAALIAAAALAAPPAPAHPEGDAAVEAYLRAEVLKIRDSALADVKTLDDWKARRETLREQLLDMLCLSPMPERTPLKPVITGTIDRPKFVVEKLHFQSRPGLYVTANLYRPKEGKGPFPAILYVCGHSKNVGGNKANYQKHPIWYASHGYVCLVLDTNELGELGTGREHHGTCVRGEQKAKWWWHSIGFTPAGVEVWNGLRGLDYLETRPEVDRTRIGVTGRSGGGAMSWYIAAVDDRIKAAAPVAGITDMTSHVADKLINGHCDCMYFVNTYRWDFCTVAALIAPRPLLLGNSDADKIFPVLGYRAVFAGYRKIWDLHGAADRIGMLETKGPHTDTKELREGVFAFMNRWLKNEPGTVDEGDLEAEKIPYADLRVFPPDALPADAINRTIDEHWVPAPPALPEFKTKAEWEKWRTATLKTLREKVFAGRPEKPCELGITKTELSTPPAGLSKGARAYEVRFDSEPGVRLRAWFVVPAAKGSPSKVAVWLLGEGDSLEKPDAMAARAFAEGEVPFLIVEPRGVGASEWEPKNDVAVRRRFTLVGQTADGLRVWDALRALEAANQLQPGAERRVLGGGPQAAGVVLAAGALDGKLTAVQVGGSVTAESAVFLNLRRHLDPRGLAALLADGMVVMPKSAEADVPDGVRKAFEVAGGRLLFPRAE